jgi:outer membrane protein assembly factor BamB
MHIGWRRALFPAKPLVVAAWLFTVAGVQTAQATWDHAHGDATGSGFADVATLPALRPSATVPGLGSFAPGAGPVIGPDGTVYLGNQQGDLIALHADGSPYWKRNLGPPSQSILASPVVDTDGSIYVLGVRSYTDHRVNPAVQRSETRLHHFLPGGGLAWVSLLPSHYPSVPARADNGASTASPNIWREGTDTAILVPAIYRGAASKDVRLLAFSSGGSLIVDKLIGAVVPQTFGSAGVPSYWAVGCGLTGIGCLVPPFTFCHGVYSPGPPDALPEGLAIPLPSVAIFTYAGGGTPWIIATDQAHSIVGWTFSTTQGFIERFRKSLSGVVTLAPPMVMPDAHSIVGTMEMRFDDECGFQTTGGHITFSGPNSIPVNDVSSATFAAVSRTADGRLIVTHELGFDVLRNGTKLQDVSYPGQTIAPAAVSRTHIYISTAGSMRSYDVDTLAKVGEVNWFGGGQSGPAIGSSGQVYALASNILFIWPGPNCPRGACVSASPVSGGVWDARQ